LKKLVNSLSMRQKTLLRRLLETPTAPTKWLVSSLAPKAANEDGDRAGRLSNYLNLLDRSESCGRTELPLNQALQLRATKEQSST
jgi:hypothetical protein